MKRGSQTVKWRNHEKWGQLTPEGELLHETREKSVFLNIQTIWDQVCTDPYYEVGPNILRDLMYYVLWKAKSLFKPSGIIKKTMTFHQDRSEFSSSYQQVSI